MWNNVTFPTSNLLNLAELVVKEPTKSMQLLLATFEYKFQQKNILKVEAQLSALKVHVKKNNFMASFYGWG